MRPTGIADKKPREQKLRLAARPDACTFFRRAHAPLSASPEFVRDDPQRLIDAADPFGTRAHDSLALTCVWVLSPLASVPVNDTAISLVSDDHAYPEPIQPADRRCDRFQLAPGDGMRRAFKSAAIERGDIPSANLPKISSTMNASPRSILPSR